MRKILSQLFQTSLIVLLLAACSGSTGLQIDRVEPAEAAPGAIVVLFGKDLGEIETITLGDREVSRVEETASGITFAVPETGAGAADQVTIMIPEDADPGETRISIANTDGETGSIDFTVEGVALAEPKPATTPNEDEVPVEAPIACNWDSVTFAASQEKIYKSKNDSSPHSVELTWNVFGNCAPQVIKINFEDGSFVEKTGPGAQTGSLPIELSKTETFHLQVIFDGEIVKELTREVPVLDAEDHFAAEVTVKNEVTGEQGVTLKPKEYNDSKKMIVKFKFDPWYDQICITSLHGGEGQAPQSKVIRTPPWRYALDHFSKLFVRDAYGFVLDEKIITVQLKDTPIKAQLILNDPAPTVETKYGIEECFDAADALTATDADGNIIGEFEFDLTGNHKVHYRLVKGGDDYLNNTIPLTYVIAHPELTQNAEIYGDKNGQGFGPYLKYTYDFKSAKRFVVVTNAASSMTTMRPDYVSQSSQKIILMAMPKAASCIISGNTDNCGESLKKFVTKVKKRFSGSAYSDQKLYVFTFDGTEKKGTYYVRSKVYNPAFVASAIWYTDDRVRLSGLDADNDIPKPDFSHICQDKNKIFASKTMEANMAGPVYGVKKLTVSGNDMDVTDGYADKGDGVWDGAATGNYKGYSPQFIFTGKTFLDSPTSFKCGKKMREFWSIKVKLVKTNKRLQFFLKLAGKSEEILIPPYENWRVVPVPNGEWSKECEEVHQPSKFDPDQAFDDEAQLSTFDNYGLYCWKFKLQVKPQSFGKGGTQWTDVRLMVLGINGDEWYASNALKTSGAGVPIDIQPKLKFEVTSQDGRCYMVDEGATDACDVEKMWVEYSASGEWVKEVKCSCSGAHSTTGALKGLKDKESFSGKNLRAEWGEWGTSKYEKDPHKIKCSCTAYGAADQEPITLKFKRLNCKDGGGSMSCPGPDVNVYNLSGSHVTACDCPGGNCPYKCPE